MFFFLSSLNAKSAKSFWGTSFACGMSLDKKMRIFWSGAGGFISSEI